MYLACHEFGPEFTMAAGAGETVKCGQFEVRYIRGILVGIPFAQPSREPRIGGFGLKIAGFEVITKGFCRAALNLSFTKTGRGARKTVIGGEGGQSRSASAAVRSRMPGAIDTGDGNGTLHSTSRK